MQRSGIYSIVNEANGKLYVGSAMKMRSRWSQHVGKLRNSCHINRHLQGAWREHGEAAFSFRPLLVCAKEDLLFYEQRAIDAMVRLRGRACLYNAELVAGSSLGRVCSPETRAKISASHIGIPVGIGHTLSAESRAKISLRNRGRVLSAEHRQKIGDGVRGMKRSDADKINRSIVGRRHALEGRLALAKLDESKVVEIRSLLESGVSKGEIVQRFSVSSCTVWRIETRRSWGYI